MYTVALNEHFREFKALSSNAESMKTDSYKILSEFLSISPDGAIGKRKKSVTLKSKLINELSSIESLEDLNFAVDEIWNSIFKSHLAVLKYHNQEDYSRASEEQINLINGLLRIFTSSSQLVLLYTLGDDLWRLALKSATPSESQEQAARTINRLFIACITERKAVISEDSRKWGTFKFASLLLRIYFHLGQLNLVQNVLKALQACELPSVDRFPRTHTVIFNFFLGRYHFGREEFEQAEACFAFCYDRLDPLNHLKQINLIMHFMIPIKLILHLQRPTPELISMLSDPQSRLFYSDLCKFISTGDLLNYNQLMELNSKSMLKFGTFAIYERMIIFLLRQRILHIHRLNDNCTRIPLSCILTSDVGLLAESTACLVANTIAKGLIRGYISEEKQYLVLSAQNPFPKSLPSAILCDRQ